MGLARNLHQSVNGGVTQSGVTLGTFDYISPEQALDPRRADVRSDIYSLGCTFYHALTGRPPVPEGTAAKKLFAHQHEPVLDPRVLNPAVPDELAAVLSRMMAKDPARRYQTPAELIAALTAVARRMNLGTDAMPALDPALVPADPSAVQVLPRPPRLSVGLVVGVAALAVAAVVLFGLPGPDRDARTPIPPEMTGSRTGPAAEPIPPAPAPAPPAPGAIQVAARADDLARLLADPAVHRGPAPAGQDLRPDDPAGRRVRPGQAAGDVARATWHRAAAGGPRRRVPGDREPDSLPAQRHADGGQGRGGPLPGDPVRRGRRTGVRRDDGSAGRRPDRRRAVGGGQASAGSTRTRR